MAASARRPGILPIALVMFGLGLLAIVVIFVSYATGSTDLPLWLNLAALLCPAGLIFGVVATVLNARRR